MNDFALTWRLTRGRFLTAISGLDAEALNWRIHDRALTLGETALHVAGVEISFATQMMGQTPEGEDARLKAAATDGVVNDRPFPFSPEEITPEFVARLLARSLEVLEPMIDAPDAYRDTTLVSALGPVIDGNGAFARLAQHPAYHEGQAHLVKSSPGFPKG